MATGRGARLKIEAAATKAKGSAADVEIPTAPKPCRGYPLISSSTPAVDRSPTAPEHAPFAKAAKGCGTPNPQSVVQPQWDGCGRISEIADSQEEDVVLAGAGGAVGGIGNG